jgi:hypothetical protein
MASSASRRSSTTRTPGRFNAGRVVFGDKDATYHAVPDVAGGSEHAGVPALPGGRHLAVLRRAAASLNETDKSTSWGTGLSEQTLAFLIYTLDPDLGRIEAELNYKLFYGIDFYVEFDRDALMAMDPLKAAQVAQAEIATGTLLINERRRHKNRPPVAKRR